MNRKPLHFFTFLLAACLVGQLHAQCPQQPTLNVPQQPDNCTNAYDLNQLWGVCRTVCFDNTGATNSGSVQNMSCTQNDARDLYFYSYEACSNIPNYNRSVVFRWEDWPNRLTGAAPPKLAAHAEIAGNLGGIINVAYDCTSPAPTQNSDFAAENIYCSTGEQFYLPPNGVPCTPFALNVPGAGNVTVNDLGIYFQAVTSDGGVGNLCFQVSSYESGWLCGDATPLTLVGNNNAVSATASGCLCQTALNGTMLNNLVNDLPAPCGVETPASAWYEITLPYACNQVNIRLPQWGGNGAYNLALLSGVSCPGTFGSDPIGGGQIYTPGATLAPGAVIEAGACGQDLNVCRVLPAGTYWVYVSGATERPTFTVEITVNNAAPVAGTATSPQNGGNVCSGANVSLNTAGTDLPLAACGQTLSWFISPNVAFNPYNGQGTYLGSGTGPQTFALPLNNNCSPQTFYIKGVVSDAPGAAQAVCQSSTNTISVTVYPEIGQASILNNTCAITVAGRCPNFTVNGTPGSFTYIAGPQDDGTVQVFTVSNGLPACNAIVTDTVRCNITCTQPTASATAVCNQNDPFNFYIDVDFEPGSATTYLIESSDGSQLPVSQPGTYQIGPFTNGNNITVNITNTENVDCNLPLGSYTNFCNTSSCPNLTSASIAVPGGGTNVCEGATLLLQATVDQGVVNQDYSIQWFMNGSPIQGANLPFYAHNVSTLQGCNPEIQSFSVGITCLDPNAAPSNTPALNATPSLLTAYPVPDFGLNFGPSPTDCQVAPVDYCGGLIMTYTPVQNPAPGAPPTTVTYTVSVVDAPGNCAATGTYAVQCLPPACLAAAGNGVTPADNVICDGESFIALSNGASMGSDYALGYAYTTINPNVNLEQAVQAALQQNNVFGPYYPWLPNYGPNITNGVDLNAGTYYIVPFTSLDIANGEVMYTASGSLNAGAPFQGASTTITVPTIPYCDGVSQYEIHLVVDQLSNEGNLNAIDGVTASIAGNVLNLGGATNDYNRTTIFTGNPSDATFNISVSGNLFFGSTVDYSLTITYAVDNTFPTICPSCSDVGLPAVYTLLPPISLTPPIIPTVCDGESIDLNTIKPTSNIPGGIEWYGADSIVIDPPVVVPPTGGAVYTAHFYAAADSACQNTIDIPITPAPLPAVNALAAPAPICQGDVVNLTQLNGQVTNAPGTFIWYRGNPQNNPFAVQLPNALAQNQQPSDGTTYCCGFTDAFTGCTSYSCLTYTVLSLPALTTPFPTPNICPNGTYDLTALETGITAAAGTFQWYAGDPDAGGVPVANPAAVNTGGNYCVVFTDAGTGCSNKVCFTLGTHPLPQLNNLPQQGPICSGTAVDLTALQSQITNQAGSFVWYLGNPAAGGVMVADPTAATPVQGGTYYAVFTSTLTGCRNQTTLTYLVNPTPSLNTPSPAAVCAGTSVNLTDLEASMTNGAGIFQWFVGEPGNGGTPLTFGQAQNQVPTGAEVYYAVFTNGFGCADTANFQWPVNPLPTVANLPVQGPLCNGSTVDLISLQPQIANIPGAFTWSLNGNALTVAQAQAQTLTANATYTYAFVSNATGCTAGDSVNYAVYAPVTGGTATYDCNANMLMVDLTNCAGGAGGYQVAANSPNIDGETLANGASWTVLFSDSIGCPQAAAVSGTVNCIVCNAGVATAPAGVDTLCCGDVLPLTLNGAVLLPGSVVAWAITDAATGPVTDTATLNAAADAGMVFLSNPDGSFDYTNQCNMPNGTYYFTPFIAESPVIDSVVWDTLNGCTPQGAICPSLVADPNDPNWVVDTFLGVYPNGDTLNVVVQLTQQTFPPNGLDLDISQLLLDGFFPGGALPCLPLSLLYNGNPNGTWTFIVANSGTGALTFSIPDFDITVDADSCAALNGVDQVMTVPGVSGVVLPGGTTAVTFVIPPPPASFPTVNPSCESYGSPVSVIFDQCIGIQQPTMLNGISVFPNPTTGDARLEATLSTPADVSIEITDLVGKVIAQQQFGERSGLFVEQLELHQLPAGIYLLTLRAGGERKTMKVVVQR